MSLFLWQLGGELRKLFARKRTYIGFGAFLGVEILVLILLRLPRVQRALERTLERAGYDSSAYLSGLTLGCLILLATVFLLGALYLALVAGDVVSKEIEDGTLRMMLCRPVSRARILTLKFVSCVIYTIVLTVFIGVTALLAGMAHAGWGGLFVFAPTEGVFAVYEPWPGLARMALALPLLALSLCTITALGFCLSCLRMKPAAATVLTLSILFVDSILKNIPFFSGIRDMFITAKMSAWVFVFEYRVPWEAMLESYAWLAGINASLLIVGAAAFQTRDFKA
ncbi:MAG: ABC transporter permease subunit [Terrimicrobiaceae bacterium]|nr:ABC transporter permease subunit [Terrimicrobiaceae bacterium]